MPKRPATPAPKSVPSVAPATQGHWLVIQEPDTYPWETFAKEGTCSWDGVRNYQARNNLRSMRPGDPVLFYASGDAKSVVGVASVSRAHYPDPSADEPGWVSVELKAVRRLARAVSLAQIKGDPGLAGILLVRNSRLSVMPLPGAAFERIVGMGS